MAGFFVAFIGHIGLEVAWRYGLSDEQGETVTTVLLRSFDRFMSFDEARACELEDAIERTDPLREIVEEFEIDGIPEEIILASEGLWEGAGGTSSG